MKKLILVLLGLVGLLVAVALAVPFFVPVEVYKEQITAAAREATGRELVIDGDVSLSLFPRLELHADQVTFSNMPRGRVPNMASLDQLVVRLRLFPLLSGEVRVDSFVLVNPVIALEIDRTGRANWDFEDAAAVAVDPGTKIEEAEGVDDVPGGGVPILSEISLNDVRLVNGRVSYRDARAGDTVELTGINMTIALPSLDTPAEARGSVLWNGKTVNLELGAGNPRALIEGAASTVAVTLGSDPISLEFTGTAAVSEPLTVAGKVKLDVPSIRELAAWGGTPLDAPGKGLGPLAIAGDLSVKGSRISFKNAEIGLDGMTARGDFLVKTGAKVPYLKGRLDWDALDLNPYLAADTADTADAPHTTDAAALESEQSEVSEAPGGWSDDPIDFSGLGAVNADFELRVGSIVIEGLKIGQSAVKVGLKSGRLVVDLKELALYGGAGTANLVLNARGKVPLISKSLSVTGVQLEPLLTDAVGFDKMSGTANVKFSINTHGRTERQLFAGLNGTGAISSVDGAIRGLDLGEMVRNAASAFLGRTERAAAKTDYAQLKASFTIRNGIVSNRDLSLAGPHVSVTGAGTVDLNRRTIKYRVVPTALAATTTTAGGNGAGVTVPVIVDGPWADPRFRPDLASVITNTAKDPKKAIKGVKKTLKAIKKDGLGGLLQGLGLPSKQAPAKGADPGAAPSPTLKDSDPRRLLKGLFGK